MARPPESIKIKKETHDINVDKEKRAGKKHI